MVLRALLNQLEAQLTIFRGAGRRLGFAEEISAQIREFTNHGLSPGAVREMAAKVANRHGLPEKLHDFALLFEKYQEWLVARRLQDSDALLSIASEHLDNASEDALRVEGVWFDGFAQLTPIERRLLTALLRFARKSTLAFCLEPDKSARSPLSPWYLVSETLGRCKSEIEGRYGKAAVCDFQRLEPAPAETRFAHSPALRHLERQWGSSGPASEPVASNGAVRVIECGDPEAEAVCCAREILRFVRGGGRFREAAVLVRDFQNDYPHVLRRVFRRYEIPFFLDQRESVTHHPLAELTRGALRTIAFDFRQRDWFPVLKCGLVHLRADQLDELENEALARGWEGSAWRTGFKIQKNPNFAAMLNSYRERLVQPSLSLAELLGSRPPGSRLAEGLRALWKDLAVQEQLENWAEQSPEDTVHATVWDQMNAWLDDVQLAFGDQELSLAQWLPILDAGLAGLTVGIIPPVLDEVLIGAVDRSRNPDLKLLCIAGFNEQIFPALPKRERLLTEDDHLLLSAIGSNLARIPAIQLAEEQFYGYIACTRAREELVISYSRTALDGAELNPSRFISHLQRIFPGLATEQWSYPGKIEEILHRTELPFLGPGGSSGGLPAGNAGEHLQPEIAERLYGPEIAISVSSLERFASCPFRFFVEQGLKIREREEFLLDVREKGSFQHAVLAKFHEEVTAEGRKWRQLSPLEAREKIGGIADREMEAFHDGLLIASGQNLFTAQNYKSALQDFIEVVIDWFNTNHFDPEQVEFGFGPDTPIPGWRIPLEHGHALMVRGRVDRIDLRRSEDGDTLCVIMDYKSGAQKPDRTLLHHGIQQQLPAYLLAMARVPEIATLFKVNQLVAAGCFLLPLTARYESAKNRTEVLGDAVRTRKTAYTHNGLFDVAHLGLLDADAADGGSGQFTYGLTANGVPRGNSFNALPSGQFTSILTRSEALIREFGEKIYAGEISVRPYKKGQSVACDICSLQAVCRFDPWTQEYNVLVAPDAKAGEKTKKARRK
jgi:ATP-dependent helicase/nuclease subunit B